MDKFMRALIALSLGTVAVAAIVVGVPSEAPSAGATAAGIETFVPARLVESRSGESTVDARQNGIGRRRAGQVTTVNVAGRAGVPANAAGAILNVTAIKPDANGYITVYPCDRTRPLASTLNYAPGQVIANGTTVQLSKTGTICIYTHRAMHLIVDITGYTPTGSNGFEIVVPARLRDSRPGEHNVDGRPHLIRRPRPGQVRTVKVAGRAGVPSNARAAVLNVTAIGPEGDGFVTLYPCGTDRPVASTLNYAPGQVVANGAIVRLSESGAVCIYSHRAMHLVVDVTGYIPPPPPQPIAPPPAPPCATSSGVTQAECDALVALHHATNGPGWTNDEGWATATDPCTWFGVVCDAGGLSQLQLTGNNLSGTLPQQVGDLTSLQSIQVGKNSIGGMIPPAIGDLTHLTSLFLNYNDFVGVIPRELGQLSSLGRLELDGNELSGAIPPELGNLPELWLLSATFNDLTAAIPSELGDIDRLETLRLAGNGIGGHGLYGAIPAELGQLENLYDLSLDSNKLSGAIPAELGRLSRLANLRLESNDLSGDVTGLIAGLKANVAQRGTPMYSIRMYGNDCLTVTDAGLADWVAAFDSRWNDGCAP